MTALLIFGSFLVGFITASLWRKSPVDQMAASLESKAKALVKEGRRQGVSEEDMDMVDRIAKIARAISEGASQKDIESMMTPEMRRMHRENLEDFAERLLKK